MHKERIAYIIRRMNWKNIIQDLIDNGYSQKTIGEYVALSQASISDLYVGKTKSTYYEAGKKLIALHKRVMRKAA